MHSLDVAPSPHVPELSARRCLKIFTAHSHTLVLSDSDFDLAGDARKHLQLKGEPFHLYILTRIIEK